ncbi:hypothetical protein E0H22_19560 [Rhodopseudomonas boonkerdii]|uniref:hypothetical protein n=1 Tax=Rhodopseudomonas boonkerdii TaxID=475937 RepID=UPI001E57A1CA|nr:hypothetical protein [Rhodopseudomonas boonkerdii]UGV27682.1 hypothetical protein E0H22_19560 [Rhodopseudomonas boonkerdii]
MKRRNQSPSKQFTDSIEEYYATKILKALGMTDDQLSQCRFLPKHMDTRFDRWAFTWAANLPSAIEQNAIPFLKPYLTYRWVTQDAPPEHHSIADAWEELSQLAAESTIQMGLRWRSAQQKNSRRSRKRHYISSLKMTMAQFVDRFSREIEVPQLSYADAWVRFYAYLETKDLDPKEVDGHYEYFASLDDRAVLKFATFKRYLLIARKAARR